MQCLHLSLDHTMDIRTGRLRPLLGLLPVSPKALPNRKRVSLYGPCDASSSHRNCLTQLSNTVCSESALHLRP